MVRPSRRHCSSTLRAVEPRQADVEDDRVVGLGVAEEMPLLAVEGVVDDVAGLAQRLAELLVQVAVVLDDEYAHAALAVVQRAAQLAGMLTAVTCPS